MTEPEHASSTADEARRAIDRMLEAAAEDPRVAPILDVLREAQARGSWSADELERLFRKAARRLEAGR